MKRYEYTLHAKQKFSLPEIQALEITKEKVENVIEDPAALDRSEEQVVIAIAELSNSLSLCVAYRKSQQKIRIITFYPAEKGRYERKILPRR